MCSWAVALLLSEAVKALSFSSLLSSLADHFGGKLHIGFVTIREKILQLEVMVFPCMTPAFPVFFPASVHSQLVKESCVKEKCGLVCVHSAGVHQGEEGE